MKQIIITSFLLSTGFFLSAEATDYYGELFCPSAPPAGDVDSTAIQMSSNAIVAWADGYKDVQYGTDVDDTWKTPEKALGAAAGTSFDIVCLGRGGQITLTFSKGIANKAGADFAIFENGFSDTFLELAHVEVSSDGTHFLRFPNYSYTQSSVGGYGNINTRLIYGLASKYRQGFGTPFDLSSLSNAYESVIGGGSNDFSSVYIEHLTNTFPLIDLDHISYVRIVDIVGDGNAKDCRGEVIYDPYPTGGSAGFDLDAIAVLNPDILPVSYADWAATYGVSTNGTGDADGDGILDMQEYAMNGDPLSASSSPAPLLSSSTNQQMEVVLQYKLSRESEGDCWVEGTSNLTNSWVRITPLRTEREIGSEETFCKDYFSATNHMGFFRLVFQAD